MTRFIWILQGESGCRSQPLTNDSALRQRTLTLSCSADLTAVIFVGARRSPFPGNTVTATGTEIFAVLTAAVRDPRGKPKQAAEKYFTVTRG